MEDERMMVLRRPDGERAVPTPWPAKTAKDAGEREGDAAQVTFVNRWTRMEAIRATCRCPVCGAPPEVVTRTVGSRYHARCPDLCRVGPPMDTPEAALVQWRLQREREVSHG